MKYCFRCGKLFTTKSNLNSHLRSKKECPTIILNIEREIIINNYNKYLPTYLEKFNIISDDINKYKCDDCNSYFTFKNNYYRHKKYNCKNKELSITNGQKILDLENQIKEIIEKIGKQGTSSIKNTQLNIEGNSGQVAETINNITINNYGQEDLSSIDQDVFESIASNEYNMIQKMVEYIHYEIVSNRNIYIPSVKEKYAMVLNGDKWDYINKKDLINQLVSNNYDLLVKLFNQFKTNLKTINAERTRQILEYCGYDAEERFKIKEDILISFLNKNIAIRNNFETLKKTKMKSR